MVANKPRYPWGRRRGEPDAAYARFLLYRNLGPTRSTDAAYRAYLAMSEPEAGDGRVDAEAAQGDERRRAPGSWQREAAAHEWEDHASAWDVATMADVGRAAIAAFCAALERASARCLAALVNDDVAPENWLQIIQTIDALGGLIPPDLIRDAALQGECGREDVLERDDQFPRHGTL